jgi:hypothetical protein
MGDSYARPHTGYTFNKLIPPPRDLLPIYPPPEPLALPALPTPARPSPPFDAPYILSTHLVPSAYLRTSWNAPVPPMPDVGTKEERMKALQRTSEVLREQCPCYGPTDGYPRVLWNCLNRYVRRGLDDSSSTGVTLFLAHATGFPKEVRFARFCVFLSLVILHRLKYFSGLGTDSWILAVFAGRRQLGR